MGLLASFVAVMTYRMAQLGLLYIVLLTLGALALLGLWHGELLKLWRLISTLNILLHGLINILRKKCPHVYIGLTGIGRSPH
jgi:hypothetical protein